MKNLALILTFIFSLSLSTSICNAIEITETKEVEKPVDIKEVKETNDKVITNSIGMKLRLIEPGEFIMGSEKGDEWTKNERPAQKVKITESLYIGVYEVTQEEYETVIGSNPSGFRDFGRPVEKVSWFDAEEFCKKLSEKEGVTYRLPTEAEWEYACRAVTKTEYYWGDIMDGKYAVYKDNSKMKTQKVGTKLPNKWDLYDMSGNLWEWCKDSYPEKDEINYLNGRRTKKGAFRAVRGGSWCSNPESCSSVSRGNMRPVSKDILVGFRIVRTASDINH